MSDAAWAAASPRPWCIGPYPGHVREERGDRLVAGCRGYSNNMRSEEVAIENDANAEVIVEAVNAHERLVREVVALQMENARLRDDVRILMRSLDESAARERQGKE